jgi:hypothetical protein
MKRALAFAEVEAVATISTPSSHSTSLALSDESPRCLAQGILHMQYALCNDISQGNTRELLTRGATYQAPNLFLDTLYTHMGGRDVFNANKAGSAAGCGLWDSGYKLHLCCNPCCNWLVTAMQLKSHF